MAGEKEGVAFVIMSIDHHFFTTPYERTAIMGGAYMGREGSPASVVLNPAALYSIKRPDAMATWTQCNWKGDGGAIGRTSTQAVTESVNAQLTDTGIYVALPLGAQGGVLAIGADSFNTTYSAWSVTEPRDNGSRLFAAYSSSLGKNISWGYGLMCLDDCYGWGTRWYNGISLSKYDMKHQSQNWRHRLALQGDNGGSFRWGIQGTYGYGEGDNYWNGVDNDGKERLECTAFRGGVQWQLSRRTRLACDIDWQNIDIQFGKHTAAIGHSATAYYKGTTLRAMLGLEYSLSKSLSLRGGYRHSSFNVEDLCNKNAMQGINTAALGLDYRLDDRLNVSWNGEYTWMGYGDFTQSLSIRYSF